MQAAGTAVVALVWVASRVFTSKVWTALILLAGIVGGGLLFWGWRSLPAEMKTFLDLAYSTLLFLVTVGMLLTVLPRFVAVRRERGQVLAGATRPVVWTRLIALAGGLYFLSGMVLLDHVLTALLAGSRPDSWNAALTTFELFLQAILLVMLSLIFMRQVSVRGVLVRLTFYPWNNLQNFRLQGGIINVESAQNNQRQSIQLFIRPAKRNQVAAVMQERLPNSPVGE